MVDREKLIDYLSERRDWYRRLQEKEESKVDVRNPGLHIEYMSKRQAFEEVIHHIKFGGEFNE